MALINKDVDKHLNRICGGAGYSVSGATATVGSVNLTEEQLEELIRLARQGAHKVVVTAGVLKVLPR